MTTDESDSKKIDAASKDEPGAATAAGSKAATAAGSKAATAAASKAATAAGAAAELAKAAEQDADSAGQDGGPGEPDEKAGQDKADQGKADQGKAAKPEVKPPWQRAGDLAPESGATGIPAAPAKKKRPIITGTAAPKLDLPAAEAGEKAAGDRFVESPTRNIGRAQVKAKSLPNLDEIHATPAGAGARAGGLLGRSAPTHVGASGGSGSRALRATVQIRRIDPWSTLKISAILSVIGFFIWMIAVAVLYLVLDGMGVWSQVNSSVGTLTDGGGAADAIGAGTIFGWAFLLGLVDAVLLTALASVGAFIYNLCADFIGGVEVTLADLD